MNPMDEADHLIAPSLDERPRSFLWQIFQCSLYLLGSCCFTIGSCLYFTEIYQTHAAALSAAGWLFTIGSTMFVCADLQDWWDYRTGYCFQLNSSTKSRDLKIELNVFGSMIGIAFYLVGSFLFIPIFDEFLTIGEWFFIFGSVICSLSLVWKLYRIACENLEQKFRCQTLFRSKTIVLMDLFSLIGNLCFFFGTILFLPYLNTTNSSQNRATGFFVFGSICFLLTSILLLVSICSSHFSIKD